MKHLCTILATALAAAFSASAAVPLRWSVETSRAQPAQFDAYHGTTLGLEASLQSYSKPLAITNEAVSIYWQTNGMANIWWSAPATASNNVVRADFTPAMDPGAPVVHGFLGVPGEIYSAEFHIRFRPSPGATPNEIEFPPRVIDFAQVSVTNAPWTTPADVAGIVTNVTRHAEDWPKIFGASEILWLDGKWTLCDIFEGDIIPLEVAQEPNASDFWAATLEFPAYMQECSRTVTTVNALGLARLEDIPDNIVTTDNIESEVARQLDGVDQVRSRRILRADGPGEYGNGPGVMIYDFTSDRRWWKIAAPALSASVSAPSPLSNLAPGSHVSRTLLRTDGTSGTARCASATWRVGVVELDDGSYGLDITATVTNGTVGVASASGGGPGAGVTYVYNAYNNYYYAFENFRADSVVTNSQYSVTVNGLYDYRHKSGYSTVNFYSNQTWSVTLTSSAGAYETSTNEYLRVINSLDHHRYYDPGLRCTWEIAVTNGCFFAEQISTNNLLSGGAR